MNLADYTSILGGSEGSVSYHSSHLSRVYRGLDEEGYSDDSRDILVDRGEVCMHGGTTKFSPVLNLLAFGS